MYCQLNIFVDYVIFTSQNKVRFLFCKTLTTCKNSSPEKFKLETIFSSSVLQESFSGFTSRLLGWTCNDCFMPSNQSRYNFVYQVKLWSKVTVLWKGPVTKPLKPREIYLHFKYLLLHITDVKSNLLTTLLNYINTLLVYKEFDLIF